MPPDEDRDWRTRRWFLWLGILLTLVGVLLTAAGIALPAWQVLDLPELSAQHYHAIFYDCVRSEVTPLDRLHARDVTVRGPNRRCTTKLAGTAEEAPQLEQQVRLAVEEGDLGAREMLNHRFLPQHKAVVFFFVFTVLFAIISVLVGSCSSCFVPNAILHVVSVGLATSCSLLADIIFFLGATREDNRRVRGPMGTHQQHLSYAFFVHAFGSFVLVLSTLASAVAAYLLLSRECRKKGWRHRHDREEEQRMAEGLVLSGGLRHRTDTMASSELLPPPPPTPLISQAGVIRQQLGESVPVQEWPPRGDWSATLPSTSAQKQPPKKKRATSERHREKQQRLKKQPRTMSNECSDL